MLQKLKQKLYREKSDFDKFRKELSYKDNLILFGTFNVIKEGYDAADIKVTQQVMKMFYVYLKIELQKDQPIVEFQAVYPFVNKCIFGKADCVEYIKESDLDELKQLFERCYEIFTKDTVKNSALENRLRKITDSSNLEYLSISDHKKMIIQHVYDLIDYHYLCSVSKTLKLDNFIDYDVEKTYTEAFDEDLSKKENMDKLNLGIRDRIIELKLEILDRTIKTIKKDLVVYLQNEKFKEVKKDVINSYGVYQGKLNNLLYPAVDPDNHYIGENIDKTGSHETFFDLMNKLNMNWVYDYSSAKGDSGHSYVYIYDLIMYKYRLLTYFYLNKSHNKKKKNRVIKSLDKDNLSEDKKIFYFFNEHIRSERDINAHIIRFFDEKDQTFIKMVLGLSGKAKYKKKGITPIFFSLADMNFKHKPLSASNYFPIQITAKEFIKYRESSNLN